MKSYEKRRNTNLSNKSKGGSVINEREKQLIKEKELKEIEDRVKAERAMREMEERLRREKEKKEKEDKRNEEFNKTKEVVPIEIKKTDMKTEVKSEVDMRKKEENELLTKEKVKAINASVEKGDNKSNDKNKEEDKEMTKETLLKLDYKPKEEKCEKAKTIQINSNTISTQTTNTTMSSITFSSVLDEITTNTIGFSNLGNTCFMSTCLQIIIHSSPFISRLYQSKDYIHSSSPRSKPLTEAFYSLCEETKVSRSSISPSSLKSSFGRNHHEYLGYSQHDTQEFCRVFLEDLSKELNTVVKTPPYKELASSKKSKVVLNKDYDVLFKERENSIVIDTFYGQTINIFRCTCNCESYSFEKFLDLPVLLNNSEIETQQLDELLKKHFSKEAIQWSEKCESCSMKTMHDKDIRLSHLPDVLFISFQRFNPRTKRKNSTRIQFSEELNLIDYVDKECLGEQSTKYKLIGISNHSGSIDFGHYYAYVKLKSGWFEFNDSHVSKIGSISYSCNTVYILAYQREDLL